MEAIRYRAKRVDAESIYAYTSFFADDVKELDPSKEYQVLLYVHEAPPKQLELPGREENVECVIEYDNESFGERR